MKTYTFNLGTSNKKNNPSKSNNISYINALISSNLKKAAPYLFDDGDIFGGEIIIPARKAKKTIDIDITIKNGKKHTSLDFTKYTDFMKAIDFLTSNKYDDSADFYLSDGTPIRIFDDEIQIGYELIPLRKLTKKKYNSFSNKTKKAIIDLYIKISK